MLLTNVIENLKEIKNVEYDEVENEIITAFGDYEFEGETDVTVSSPNCMNGFQASEGTHSAYINHEDAPIIKVEIEETEEGLFSIVDAWEA